MKPVIRYQSQLLYRKSYKPIRSIRIRPATRAITFRFARRWPVAIRAKPAVGISQRLVTSAATNLAID